MHSVVNRHTSDFNFLIFLREKKFLKIQQFFNNFQIMDKYNPPDDFLPESYTCFFLLKMPRYSCKRVLKEKLTYAIHFCKSIGKF